MTAHQAFYGNIISKLVRTSSRAILGVKGLRNDALRAFLSKELSSEPGNRNALLADPVFEAAFGYEESDVTLAELQGNLLTESLVKALARPSQEGMTEDYTFPLERKPYKHQLLAWKALMDPEICRSALVTSGTGSGKTECFLIPILNDLASEQTAKKGLGEAGVRAIFLYPLNALIKSQKDRLQAWSEPFKGQIRFCLYNGDTPDQGKSDWLCEVPDRRTLRKVPPQIVVTNPTMLEYMLVRTEDQPILNQSRGKLRWIVIDEAHTYLGSQAAELTLLLRRTLHAFGCSPGDVHFIATSATLGDKSEASRQKLAQFLADIAGVPVTQVSVIYGARHVPADTGTGRVGAPPSPESLTGLSAGALYEAVASHPAVVQLRSSLAKCPQTLSQLSSVLWGTVTASDKHKTLEILDLCAQARDADDQPFLPLRGHLFHRTLNGLWACSNGHCPERKGTLLDDTRWPFGMIYLERRTHCTCGAPAFDLVQCGGCGAEYLLASESERDGETILQPFQLMQDEDEFLDVVEPPQNDLADDNDDEIDTNTAIGALPRLITAFDQATHQGLSLSEDNKIDYSGAEGIRIHLRAPELDDHLHLKCPECNEKASGINPVTLFRAVRVGAPFMLISTTPLLLNAMPARPGAKSTQPLEGRRLITFTDSRQGTARTVVKAQHQVERDYVDSLLYHHLAAKSQPADPVAIAEKEQAVAALTPIANNSALKTVLNNLLNELNALKAPKLGSLDWVEAGSKLSSAVDFQNWVRPGISELTYSQLSDAEVVELCLFREFFVRPKRQYSLEGLGLVQLIYPELESQKAPAIMRQRNVSDAEWIDLLRVSLDFYVRSGSPSVEIPEGVQRWLGFPGKASLMKNPGDSRKNKDERVWPSSKSSFFKYNRLVRLLAYAFKLDPSESSDRVLMDEMLGLIWQSLKSCKVMSPVEGGYRLVLKDKARLSAVQQAWFCPVTRRLLPVAFRGITPYLPDINCTDDMALCKQVTMPVLPTPFWNEATEAEIESWIEHDPAIQELRVLGAWENLSDRIANFARYFRAAEHSAQLSGAQLSKREREFKEGKINLLSCSTTMEMGVDIGGLTGVAMNNVPPHPANFMQRAGRAGRRGESTAISFTLCKATPHGEAVFRNPLWPFVTSMATPRVDLRSEPIVQRHINALALSTYLAQQATDSFPKLRAGWFFEAETADVSAPFEKFAAWCESPESWPDNFTKGLKNLISGSVLDGRLPAYLMSGTVAAIHHVAEDWNSELDSLLSQRALVKTQEGDSKPEQAINIQLDRWRKEYLLGVLATRTFLPGYGFPTGVVPLVTTTAEDLRRKDADSREDNRQCRSGYPSRSLATAIRDYAPGTDTVLDGRVFRSQGITLNWQLPAELEAAPEIQNLSWLWKCSQCRDTGIRISKPDHCPGCGNANNETFKHSRFLEPAGFAVDIRSKPHNDISAPQYIPVKEPLVSMAGADWMMLSNPLLGRYRVSSHAHLFHHSEGLGGKGYSVCLRCGLADSMTANGDRSVLLTDHKRLRGGRLNDRERVCPGNTESWAIVDDLSLGVANRTEIFELQMRNTLGQPIKSQQLAYTLAVALRTSLASRLGIEEAELGALALPSTDQSGKNAFSIVLFDTATGGAGYAGQVTDILPELLNDMSQSTLKCPNECDAACQACLLSYETQHNLDKLNRQAALQFLSKEFLGALSLQDELRVFGADSRLELEPLAIAVNREWQKQSFDEITLQLGGDKAAWEPLNWRLVEQLQRLSRCGVQVNVVLDKASIADLDEALGDELVALLTSCKASLIISPQLIETNGKHKAWPLMELKRKEGFASWASTKLEAMSPNSDWGTGVNQGQFIKALAATGVLDEAMKSSVPTELNSLRKSKSGTVALKINKQVDGAIKDFGWRAWSHLTKQNPELNDLLQRDSKLQKIIYVDRYLKSPLTIALLYRFLQAMLKQPGGLGSNTSIEIFSAALGTGATFMPARFNNDWQDRQDRQEVIRLVIGALGSLTFKETDSRSLPHAREMELEWEDGKRYSIRFDQGMGYWKMSNKSKPEYPFRASVTAQAQAIVADELMVEASSNYPTYWYAVPG